ncbi:MAG: methyltransferase domain-containing protein [Hyphomicrobium sp.]
MPVADKRTLDIYAQEAAKYATRDRKERADGFLDPFIAMMPPGAVVLDLGCGAGWAAALMQDRGFDVHALDASPEMAALAQAKLKRTVRVASFESVEETGVYDGIWASGALLHVPKSEMPALLARLARALKPGGLLLATFKSGEGEARDKLGRFYSYYALAELQRLFGAVPGLAVEGHLESTGTDFTGNVNTVYALEGRRTAD